ADGARSPARLRARKPRAPRRAAPADSDVVAAYPWSIREAEGFSLSLAQRLRRALRARDVALGAIDLLAQRLDRRLHVGERGGLERVDRVHGLIDVLKRPL